MAFSYANGGDLETYVPGMVANFWGNEAGDVNDALERASRIVNEWLKGLQRFADSDIPIPVESDGNYAEVLVRLTVYEAAWTKVQAELAGEAFTEHWAWLPENIRLLRTGIANGDYRLGDFEESVQKHPVVNLTRKST